MTEIVDAARGDFIVEILTAALAAHPVFVAQGWTWTNGAKHEPTIPTAVQIALALRSSVDHALQAAAEGDEGWGMVRSGRFRIQVDEEEVAICLELAIADITPGVKSGEPE